MKAPQASQAESVAAFVVRLLLTILYILMAMVLIDTRRRR